MQTTYPSPEYLEQSLVDEIPGECYLHVTIVHARQWWCVSLSIPKTIQEKESLKILRRVEEELASAWPKKACRPRRRQCTNGKGGTYWLPAEDRESEDFKYFYPKEKAENE